MKEKKYEFNGNYYNEEQYFTITDAESAGVDKKFIDLISKVNEYGNPKFNDKQMKEIIKGANDGLSIEEVSVYALPVFGDTRMNYIRKALKSPKIYDTNCINKLILIKLDNPNIPVYDLSHVEAIMNGYEVKLKEECISLCTKLDETGMPMFSGEQAKKMIDFFVQADAYQYKQIEDSIEDGLGFDKFSAYMDPDISADKMRIYRSLIQMKCDSDDIKMFEQMNCTYDDLKNIKYAMQYDDYFKFGGGMVGIGLSLSTETLLKSVANKLQCKYNFDDECKRVVERCLMYKMPPEQIEILTDPEYFFDDTDMKDVAIGFLNGLTVDEVKKILHESEKSSKILPEMFENAIKSKISLSMPDEYDIDIKSDWFEYLER